MKFGQVETAKLDTLAAEKRLPLADLDGDGKTTSKDLYEFMRQWQSGA